MYYYALGWRILVIKVCIFSACFCMFVLLAGAEDGLCFSPKQFQVSVPWEILWSFSLELFPSPVLRASSTRPTERDTVTLTCETQLSQQRPESQLLFRFVKQSNNVGSDWKNSPEFQFTPIRRENSGSYWCEARRVNSLVQKRSQELQIEVQGKC